MSSREIADLCEKRHDHVMRDIRDMLAQLHGEEALPKFGGGYLDANRQKRPCFLLPKRETLILVSGYSVELRARIIDRWQELAQAAAPSWSLPGTYAEALRALADESERAAQLNAKIAADAPKVAFVGRR